MATQFIGDLAVVATLGRKQHDLGPKDSPLLGLVRGYDAAEFASLGADKGYPNRVLVLCFRTVHRQLDGPRLIFESGETRAAKPRPQMPHLIDGKSEFVGDIATVSCLRRQQERPCTAPPISVLLLVTHDTAESAKFT